MSTHFFDEPNGCLDAAILKRVVYGVNKVWSKSRNQRSWAFPNDTISADGMDAMPMNEMPRILMVGAGAVGQAYGFHLARAGCRITYFVRQKYVASLRQGLLVRCLNERSPTARRFDDFEIMADMALVADTPWDQVWLCVSSPALRGGWLKELVAGIGDASLIMLQPGIDDRSFVLEHIPETRLVAGLITLASYQAPLPGGHGEAATHWWFPPFSNAPFCGPQTRVDPIVASLRRGGLPGKRVQDISFKMRLGSGILMPVIAALEIADWHFADLVKSGGLKVASTAAREATNLVLPNQKRLLVHFVTLPVALRLILFIARKSAPFDLEAMLKVHFTKVGDQTRIMLQKYLELADASKLPASAIGEFATALTSTSR